MVIGLARPYKPVTLPGFLEWRGVLVRKGSSSSPEFVNHLESGGVERFFYRRGNRVAQEKA